jgi:hypothetical protein
MPPPLHCLGYFYSSARLRALVGEAPTRAALVAF